MIVRVGLLAVALVVASAFGLRTAPDRSGVPRWIAGNPATSDGWPVGHFGCRPREGLETYDGVGPGDPVHAQSTPVARGASYCFEVEHCGLTWLADFDGSFWEVVRWGSPEPPPPLVNGGFGSMRLVSDDEAEFREWRPGRTWGRLRTALVNYDWSWGERVTLRRLDGPVVLAPCM